MSKRLLLFLSLILIPLSIYAQNVDNVSPPVVWQQEATSDVVRPRVIRTDIGGFTNNYDGSIRLNYASSDQLANVFLKLNQTTPQTTIGTFTFPNIIATSTSTADVVQASIRYDIGSGNVATMSKDSSNNLTFYDTVTGLKTLAQLVAGSNHAALSNLDYASAGHTGFEPTVTKGNLTEFTSNVFTITGGTGAIIGSGVKISVATSDTSTNGILTSTNWNTFNNKADYSFGANNFSGTGNFITTTNATADISQAVTRFNVGSIGTIYPNGNNLTFYDVTTGHKTLAELASGGAPVDAQYYTALANATLTNEIVITGLSTLNGIAKADGAGAFSAATAGTDYENALTFSAPLSRAVNTISIPASTSLVNGYLSSVDWATFNNKQSSLTGSISGIANQVNVSSNSNSVASNITLSAPQNLNTNSNVTFGSIYSTGNMGCTGTATADVIQATTTATGDVVQATTRLDIGTTGIYINSTAANLPANSIGPSQLISTSVTAGSYTATSLTVDADGRLTSASSGSAGGDMSYANTRFFLSNFSRDTAAASGTQAVTGLGFSPKAVIFLSDQGGVATDTSFGVDSGSNQGAVFWNHPTTASSFQDSIDYSIFSQETSTADYRGEVSSLDADGFTVNWTRTGAPTGTIRIVYLAFR